MFNAAKKIRHYEALVDNFETWKKHKIALINEQEKMIQFEMQVRRNLEECNEILANENMRITQERDFLDDLCSELHAEWLKALEVSDRWQEIDRENERLWHENVVLRAALDRVAPQLARDICQGR